MAIAAVGPLFMPAMVPGLIDCIHHVTVVASRWVVAKICGEIRDVHPHPDNDEQRDESNDERSSHEFT